MNREESNKEAQRRRLPGRLRHWWSSRFDRLPDWLFAPEPEPAPIPPTREEFHDLSEQVQVLVREGDYERELERIKDLSDQRKTFHDETSKTIRRVFYTLVGTCLFCVITLAGSPDIQLLTPEATVTLPALNYDMGFGAFLLVGPVVLIALTIYLHIFVSQHRRLEVVPESQQPMLPNFSGWAPRLAVLVIFYWMVPVTLAVFAWKSWPRPVGPLLGYIAFGVAAALVLLQISRCPRAWRSWALPLLVVAYALFMGGVFEITAARQLNLFKAVLSGKDLRLINLSGVFLLEADLSKANLSGAILSKANLSGADLSGADLSAAFLARANLSGSDLSGANLSGAILSKANLSGASLSKAILSRAMLFGANLSGANLSGADLSGADLSMAILADDSMYWTALRRGEPSETSLEQNELDRACGDETTVLPEGLKIKPCPKDQGSATSQEPRESPPAVE